MQVNVRYQGRLSERYDFGLERVRNENDYVAIYRLIHCGLAGARNRS